MRSRVIERTDADVVWPFGRDPYVDTGYMTNVDPFPAYAHDVELVGKVLRRIDRIVGSKVFVKPTVYVLHHDAEARTNGWAMTKAFYPKPDKGPLWEGIIVLPGKRIPLHPAMTRYVTAHEYGHHVEYELLRRAGKQPEASDVAREYAQVRGADRDIPYGGRTWHKTVGELFANDFRILVCCIEPEFWPHPGFTHPSKCPAVKRWWAENF